MPKKTDAEKRAQKNYIKKFARVEIRMTPEKQKLVLEHAVKEGESVNCFINRAIDETIEHDNKKNNDA